MQCGVDPQVAFAPSMPRSDEAVWLRGRRGQAPGRAVSIRTEQDLGKSEVRGDRSLELSELKDVTLVSVGSVGAGLSERTAAAITAAIARDGFALVKVEYRGKTSWGACGTRC